MSSDGAGRDSGRVGLELLLLPLPIPHLSGGDAASSSAAQLTSTHSITSIQGAQQR